MRQQRYEKDIFNSWRNCARLGLCPDIRCPACQLSEAQIEILQRNYLSVISALAASVEVISKVLPDRIAFLLTDAQGILLKKNTE